MNKKTPILAFALALLVITAGASAVLPDSLQSKSDLRIFVADYTGSASELNEDLRHACSNAYFERCGTNRAGERFCNQYNVPNQVTPYTSTWRGQDDATLYCLRTQRLNDGRISMRQLWKVYHIDLENNDIDGSEYAIWGRSANGITFPLLE